MMCSVVIIVEVFQSVVFNLKSIVVLVKFLFLLLYILLEQFESMYISVPYLPDYMYI